MSDIKPGYDVCPGAITKPNNPVKSVAKKYSFPARLIIRLSFGFVRLNENALQILRRNCGLLVNTSEGFTKTNGSYLP